MQSRLFPWLMIASILLSGSAVVADEDWTVTLHNTTITFDAETGGILKLAHPGPGTIIETTADKAGLVDVAYPIPRFEPLRRASRYSDNVRLEQGDGTITISYDDLGLSRDLDFSGKVAARIEMREAEDGESILLRCKIENTTDTAIGQVLFPDLKGIPSFGKTGQTYFRTAGFAVEPWHYLKWPHWRAPFYAIGQYHKGIGWVEYIPGGWGLNDMITGWVDLGDFHGGLSLFPKRWGWDPIRARVMLHLSESDEKLRMLYAYNETIAPGATWESDEFCLTAHDLGWAKGIEPFRRFVHEKIEPRVPAPKHVTEGLGYRTVYMSKGYVGDPAGDVVFKFEELPELARDAKAHGLDEMVLWFWGPVFQLPITIHPHLGTKEDFVKAVRECREIGVNVTPFISVFALANPTAERYDLKLQHGWTYHTEMVPMFNPPYAAGNQTGNADASNLKWQQEVIDSCKEWFDEGVASLAWDVWHVAHRNPPNILSLTDKLRQLARAKDPQSVFAGESQDKIEIECDYLDYTWNWRDYTDIRGFNNAFPAPRLNINIDTSTINVRRSFADNIYMNIMPRKPDGVNGSDYIHNHQHLSTALKQCAKLRKQFLPYFVDGTIIGACALTAPCGGTHVSFYVREEGMLMILINLQEPAARTFTCDPTPWIEPGENGYTVVEYDGEGNQLDQQSIPAGAWTETTPELVREGMVIYEFAPR